MAWMKLRLAYDLDRSARQCNELSGTDVRHGRTAGTGMHIQGVAVVDTGGRRRFRLACCWRSKST